MTGLFGSTYFNYNIYSNVAYLHNPKLFIYISDHDLYQLDNGYDPFTGEVIVEVKAPDYHIIPFFDTVQPSDLSDEVWWMWTSSDFESMLSQISEEEELMFSGEYLFPGLERPPFFPAA
jgi:hypothetical protein